MSLVVIKDNHIKVFGTKYFVGNAPKVTIGSYGEKKDPWIGANKLEVQDKMPATKLNGNINIAGGFLIDTENSSKSDFTAMVEASLKPIGAKGGSASAIYDDLVKKHLKLIQIFVHPEDMKDAVNDSPKVLDRLSDYGSDARVAHEEFVIVEGTLADSFTGGAKFDVFVDALEMLAIKASGGTTVSGKDTITLSPGSTLAYLLVKPDWNKGKTKVDKFKPDEWSFG